MNFFKHVKTSLCRDDLITRVVYFYFGLILLVIGIMIASEGLSAEEGSLLLSGLFSIAIIMPGLWLCQKSFKKRRLYAPSGEWLNGSTEPAFVVLILVIMLSLGIVAIPTFVVLRSIGIEGIKHDGIR